MLENESATVTKAAQVMRGDAQKLIPKAVIQDSKNSMMAWNWSQLAPKIDIGGGPVTQTEIPVVDWGHRLSSNGIPTINERTMSAQGSDIRAILPLSNSEAVGASKINKQYEGINFKASMQGNSFKLEAINTVPDRFNVFVMRQFINPRAAMDGTYFAWNTLENHSISNEEIDNRSDVYSESKRDAKEVHMLIQIFDKESNEAHYFLVVAGVDDAKKQTPTVITHFISVDKPEWVNSQLGNSDELINHSRQRGM